jgi:hypothetical protein
VTEAVTIALVHATGWVMVALVVAHAVTQLGRVLSPPQAPPSPRALVRATLGPMPQGAHDWVLGWPEGELRTQAEARLIELAEERGDWEKALAAVQAEEVAPAPDDLFAVFFPPADPPRG